MRKGDCEVLGNEEAQRRRENSGPFKPSAKMEVIEPSKREHFTWKIMRNPEDEMDLKESGSLEARKAQLASRFSNVETVFDFSDD